MQLRAIAMLMSVGVQFSAKVGFENSLIVGRGCH
jgi:hypothetical protein